MKMIHKLKGGILTVWLSGDLDESGAVKIRAEIDNLIDTLHFSEMVFDFTNVDFMDSTGIGMLLGRYKKLQRAGVNMFIQNTKPQVDKIFYMSGIYEIIKKIEVGNL